MSEPGAPDAAAADPAADGRPGTGPEGRSAAAPRLGPRPLGRPPVDDESAAVFGRPRGLDGAFAAAGGGDPAAEPARAAPPPAALALAFGRPDGNAPALQRPPSRALDAGHAAPLWSAEADPWRDPA